jgi:hypothetical protein
MNRAGTSSSLGLRQQAAASAECGYSSQPALGSPVSGRSGQRRLAPRGKTRRVYQSKASTAPAQRIVSLGESNTPLLAWHPTAAPCWRLPLMDRRSAPRCPVSRQKSRSISVWPHLLTHWPTLHSRLMRLPRSIKPGCATSRFRSVFLGPIGVSRTSGSPRSCSCRVFPRRG